MIVWRGTILVTIGLSLLLLVGEWFAAFDACVANPTCNAGVPPSTLETYLALMVAGVTIAVAGVTIAVAGVTIALTRGRGLPRRAIILWL
jgi:hypothetical protein